MSFFFCVVTILLAIVQVVIDIVIFVARADECKQGLIIDSFGELRDQLESVKTDNETKCFICGIGTLHWMH